MGTRDDEEALRARVGKLEDRLHEQDAARAENEALKQRIADLERQAGASVPTSPVDAHVLVRNRILLKRVAESAREPPVPAKVWDERRMAVAAIILGISTLMCGLFLPMFGFGDLFKGAACPDGSKSAYTKHWRVIENGNVSDHFELRCITSANADVAGNEVFSYLGSAGAGAVLGVFIVGIVLMSRRARLREERLDRALQD